MKKRDLKNYILYTDIEQGHVIKTLVDVFANCLKQSTFIISQKDGIQLVDNTEDETLLFNLQLKSKNFKSPFIAPKKKLKINLNFKHFQKLTKNVKKKESIILFITKDEPHKFNIQIYPANNTKKTMSNRVELNAITIQKRKNKEEDEVGIPYGGYTKSFNIDTSDFQKIKKMTSTGKVINIKMQSGNYLQAKCDGDIYSTSQTFGELVDGFESDNDEEEEVEYSEEEEPTCYENGIYEEMFYSQIFNQLSKISGLSNQVKFYSPKYVHFPLKIELSTGNLGKLQVFLKDKLQTDFEAEERVKLQTENITE